MFINDVLLKMEQFSLVVLYLLCLTAHAPKDGTVGFYRQKGKPQGWEKT